MKLLLVINMTATKNWNVFYKITFQYILVSEIESSPTCYI